MTEWVAVFKDLGYPIAFALLVAWKVWPFIVNQVNSAQTRVDAMNGEFMKALERRDAYFADVVKELRDLRTAIERRIDR